MILTELNY